MYQKRVVRHGIIARTATTPAAPTLTPLLLGRQHELTHIEGLLTGAKNGTSTALLLHGEPGIGKSALLELLTPLLALRDKIPEVQARALGSALALEPPTPFDRFAVPAGMLSLLAAAAEEQPYLVIADDVQWLDDASRDALIFTARRLGAEGVVLLCSARISGAASDPVLEAFTGVEALAVCGLDDATASELLRREAPHRVADDVASDLIATARGNPLALTEIPRGLSPDQLAGREPLAGPVAAGERIKQAFARQLADLP